MLVSLIVNLNMLGGGVTPTPTPSGTTTDNLSGVGGRFNDENEYIRKDFKEKEIELIKEEDEEIMSIIQSFVICLS